MEHQISHICSEIAKKAGISLSRSTPISIIIIIKLLPHMRWTNYFGLRFTTFPLRLDILDSFSGWLNNINNNNNNNSSNGNPARLATCMRDGYIVKRGDCDSRLISFGWGVLVRFIWVRESSPQEEKLESTWARDLLFSGGRIVFVSITKQTGVYPLWFSEGKIQLMPKPGSFSSENQRPITCLN